MKMNYPINSFVRLKNYENELSDKNETTLQLEASFERLKN